MEEQTSREFSFRVLGEPVAKARPRFNSKTRMTYTNQKTRNAERLIQTEYIKQGGRNKNDYSGKVEIELVFVFPIRKSWSKKKQKAMLNKPHTIKPDLDNLEKTVLDALNGLAFKDDSQVCLVIKEKFWSNEPYTEIKITYEERKGF